jgi:hypothetical protein
MRLKSRLQKLEMSEMTTGTVYVVQGPNDDHDELLRERFGEDGPPAGLTVILVNTGVPRRMSVMQGEAEVI